MDPKLLFWTASLLNLGVLVGFAVLGVRYARRGEIARHQRAMKIASALIIVFLGFYLLKVLFIGREDVEAWGQLDTWILRIHELFVVQMLVAGVIAWVQAHELRSTRLVTYDANDPEAELRTAKIHRIAGRTSVAGAALGFVMAIAVLAGMFARASA
jgi:uncharacterized membrane protein YozB (DUF420 family)